MWSAKAELVFRCSVGDDNATLTNEVRYSRERGVASEVGTVMHNGSRLASTRDGSFCAWVARYFVALRWFKAAAVIAHMLEAIHRAAIEIYVLE